jgi:hypothetical protein
VRGLGFVLLWLALMLLGPATRPGRAQVGSAGIFGKVEDTSGAAISGAAVTVKNLETGATRTVLTGDNGTYRVSSLLVGRHEVKVEKPRFQSAVRSGINLEVGQNAAVDFRLELGELVQQVTVTEDVPLVNTTNSSVWSVVGEREVKDLPLNGRSFDDLITLNPGAINYSAMKSANTSTSDGNTFSISGRRTGENLFLLNGVEYTGSSQLAVTPGGVSGYLLGIDAIREFNVLTDTYSAEYGKRSGAQVMIVTQSGTNALHGTVFEFLRNSALDARNFFAQTSAPPFRQNQFGGSLGGPIRKDRWFLFGNYEGFRQALAQSGVAEVPDAQARQGLLPNASGVYTKVANLNPAMLDYTALWPQPNGPELLVNGLPSGTALSYNNPRQKIREDFGTLRSDYKLREGDWLSGAFTIDDGNSLIPLADPLFGSTTTLRSQVASLQETHVFSARVLNTATVGFSRAGFALDSTLLASFPSGLSFVTGQGPGGIVVNGGTTTTGAAGITSAGPNNAAGVWNRRNLFTYTDNVQINRGMHQISAGVWFQRLQDNEDTGSRQTGVATFTSLTTFLQGTVSTFQVIPNPNELGWRSLYGALYFSDSIRLRSNLMVQAGVRDEFSTGWNEISGRAANYIPSNYVLQTIPRVGNSVYTQNNAKHLFAPRIGVAWDPLSNGKTVIRSGFGIYYSMIDALSFLLNSLPPANGAVTYSGVPLASVLPVMQGVQPPPSCTATLSTGCVIYAPQGLQPNAQTPAAAEWNFAIEQQLGRASALRVAYVGSHGYHGLLSVDPNDIPAQLCQSATCVSGGTPGTTKGSVPQGAQYIPVQGRPNPFLGAGFFWYTEGNSSYNALQTEVLHRLSKGLQFRANYTWSKNLDMNSGLTGAQAQNQAQMILDRNDLPRDWGLAALNVTNQASISGNYELPFGRGRQGLGSATGWKGKLLGGWQLNGILTLQTGFPFTPQVGSNRSGDGDTRNPDRPSVNPSFTGPVLLKKPTQWFDPNAFVLPTPGTYGNLGRETLTGPGLAELDFSLFKNTPIGERCNLQFRSEFFNLLNHANFGVPNAIVFSSGNISPTAGLITATSTTSRQIQFGLKLVF